MSLARAALLALLAPALIATDGLRAWQGPDPEPPTAGMGELTRYFLDDTHAAGVINVKRLAASQLVKKHLQKPAEKLLDNPLVAPVLKKVGVDPFRDVEYVALVLGERSFNAPGSKAQGPLIVAQGKFNTKKFHDGMDELARDFGFTKEGEGRSLIYVFGGPDRLALHVSPNLAFFGESGNVRDAVQKAIGKKKTAFKYKAMPGALAGLREDAVGQFVGIGEMTADVTYEFAKGQAQPTVKITTLEQVGFSRVFGRAVAGEDLSWTLAFTGKDKELFLKGARAIETGLETIIAGARRAGDRDPLAKEAAATLSAIRVQRKEQTLTLEAAHKGADLAAFIEALARMIPR